MIAIIPARGGSKRIPRKNVRDFLGIPIIEHTINQIRATDLFSRIIVSTEDNEIAEIAESAGAEVLFRDVKLADDYTTTVEVIGSCVFQLRDSIDVESEIINCIYPITPMISNEYISPASKLLKSENLDYVFTAKKFESSPARSFKRGINGNAEMYFPEYETIRTQDLPVYYHDAALFYLGRAQAWVERKPILFGNSKFIEIGRYETLDVDDTEDWEFLENLYKIRKANQ
jgi:pseudaminic acid cytidylyltransferase